MSENNRKSKYGFPSIEELSTEELKRLILQDFEADEGENNVDMIIRILEELEKRESEESESNRPDVDAAWNEFNLYYRPFVKENDMTSDLNEEDNHTFKLSDQGEKASRRKSKFRFAFIAAAVLVLLMVGVITASALGIDIWKTVAKWTGETFGFSTCIVTNSERYPGYSELLEAVQKHGITQNVVPKYLPDGYQLTELYNSEDGSLFIVSAFQAGEQTIIIQYTNQSEWRSFQKDDGDPTVFRYHDVDHYIMTNTGDCVAVWSNNGIVVGITGPLTEETIQHIIESIYE